MAEPIRILDLTPTAYDVANRRPCYRFLTTLHHVAATTAVRPTPEAAYQDAQDWCAGYRDGDPGNLAYALGVAVHPRGGYVGVYEYYHSRS